MLQLTIRQVVAAGLDRATGTVSIAELSHGPFNPPPKGMSVKHWRKLIDAFVELREKYWRETEKFKQWRNDAPRAAHWKLGVRIPSQQPRHQKEQEERSD